MKVYIITYEWDNKATGREFEILATFSRYETAKKYFNEFCEKTKKSFLENRCLEECGIESTETSFLIDWNLFEEWEQIDINAQNVCED